METLLGRAAGWLVANGFRIVVVWALTLMVMALAGRFSKRLVRLFNRKSDHPEFMKRSDTVGRVFNYTVNIIMLAVAVTVTLKMLGIDIGPMLTAAGVVGITIGFGAQRFIQDVISGFLILLDGQVRVGDVVDIDGNSGVVENVTLRMTALRDLSGNVIFIRNSNVNVIKNMTKDFSRYVFDIGVSYREDVDEVIEVIKLVDEDLRNDPDFGHRILEPIEILGLDRFEDSAVVIRARTKTVPIEQWNVGREFNKRLKKAFDQKGIEIPFPHRTIYMGVDKDGTAPPLNVKGTAEPGG